MYQSIFSKSHLSSGQLENFQYSSELAYVGIIGNLNFYKNMHYTDVDFYLSARAITIAEYLKQFDIPVFLYSPATTNFKKNRADGYLLNDHHMIKHNLPVPMINADWVMNVRAYLQRHSIDFDAYQTWKMQNNRKFYASDLIASFAGNKKKTYQELQAIEGLKQPETEDVDNLEKQLADFLTRHDMIFLKPQFGHRSQKVLVVEKKQGKLFLTYYPEQMEVFKDLKIQFFDNYKSLYAATQKLIDKQWYIIQQGIDVLRQNENPLQVRTLLVNNGYGWELQEIIYVGLSGTHISNQPHHNDSDLILKDWLDKSLPKKQAKDLYQHLHDLSYKIADLCENKFPHQTNEFAIDWVMDHQFNLYLLEINTKPSIISPTVYRKTHPSIILLEEEEGYRQFLHPYAVASAKFLQARLKEAREAFGGYYIQTVSNPY